MILTITLNPAIDISYKIDKLAINTVNRCDDIIKTSGGKGLNVTRVISLLGERVCATGFLGGPNGQYIGDDLKQNLIPNDFQRISGETRNCIAILHEGNQTEILEDGPIISENEKIQFLRKYQELLKKSDIVVASGSLPKGLGNEFYGQLVYLANKSGSKFLLDCSGEALKKALVYQPYLIKPNKEEISSLLDLEIGTEENLIDALKSMKKYKIPYIVVSLGEDGALALVGEVIYKVTIPKVKAVNPVGSGDSTMAGFSIAVENNFSIEKTLKLGCVLGTLNAMEEKTGYVDKAKIEEFLEMTYVEILK